MIIDFNPEVIKDMIRQRVPCIYGDIGDPEIIDRLDFKKTGIVISTVPTRKDNDLLISNDDNTEILSLFSNEPKRFHHN